MGVEDRHGFQQAVVCWEPSASGNDRQLTRLEREWHLALLPKSGAEVNDNQEDAGGPARRMQEIEAKVIATSARSLAGLAVKVRFLKQAFIFGPTSNDEKICQSVLADIEELMTAAPQDPRESYARLSSILNTRREAPGA